MTEPTTQDVEPRTEAEQQRKDLATLRRSLPVIVGPETAELWMAFGRIERDLGHGPYAATEGAESREGLDPERLAAVLRKRVLPLTELCAWHMSGRPTDVLWREAAAGIARDYAAFPGPLVNLRHGQYAAEGS